MERLWVGVKTFMHDMSWYEYCLYQGEIPSSNNVMKPHRSSFWLYVFFYSLTKYFPEFQSIFVNFFFTGIFIKISTNMLSIFPIYP